MQGVKNMAKVAKGSTSSGFKNYDAVLAEAFKTGKIDGLERWINRVGFALIRRASTKHTRPGSVMMEHWNDARRQLKDDRALILYMKTYREEYEGRFFPKGVDLFLVGEARDKYQGGSGLADAMEAQMKEAIDSNRELKAQLQRMTTQFGQLKADVARRAGGAGGSGDLVKGPDGNPIVCHRCGGNHFVANCDKPKEWRKKKDKDEGEDDDGN